MTIQRSSSLSGLKLNDIKPERVEKPRDDEPKKAVQAERDIRTLVDSTDAASKEVSKLSQDTTREVEATNDESQQSKVRDVEEASKLADQLSSKILDQSNRQQVEQAHSNITVAAVRETLQ